MGEEVVKTGVDELLELLSDSPKIPLAEAAKRLKVPVDIVQAWVDFMVEEGILGIEYKFTTPYIYLNKNIEKSLLPDTDKKEASIDAFKKEFWEKAQKNSIPETKISALWKNHIFQELDLRKKYFYFEAKNRKLENIDMLWEQFRIQMATQ